jgi:hypothetical protein
MSVIAEYFSLFDFFIIATLLGVVCCGLIGGEPS